MAFRARVSPDPGGETQTGTGSAVVMSGLNLRTYKRAVYEALLEMIVTLELPPGERLVESDLAGRLGVSKTPVREALAMLESDGLVEATPYRGASVRWLSMNESREQGYLVDALEMPAYPMVIERITKVELAATGKVVDRLKRARKARDQRQFSLLAGEIHERLFACTGYPRLLALIHQVLGPVGRRYDNALVFPFDESWDLLRDMAVARYEAVCTRDLGNVVSAVRSGRQRMWDLAMIRASLPEVARYLRPD
ncbi:MAG: GntR family transcriptional regulator [Chloroflexi bacterium]|nr:GntR family transcriptional regulator [Chloroflexota bacterium]